MNELLALLEDPAFWAAVPALSMPFAFGVFGALFCARAGVLHLGIEGIFLLGALTGLLAAQHGMDPWIGLLAAAAVGLSAGLALGVLTGPFGISVPLAGIAITLVGASVARALWPAAATPKAFFRPFDVPFLSDLPYVGIYFGEGMLQTPLAYLAIVLALMVTYVLNRTPLGLAIRACGENPTAVRIQGRSVWGLRIGAVMLGSAMMAAGGAAITLTASSFIRIETVAGRGFLCLALAGAAGWRPGLAFAGALTFGAIEAAAPHLQEDFGAPPALVAMVAYLLAIAALAVTSRRLRWPAALRASSGGVNRP